MWKNYIIKQQLKQQRLGTFFIIRFENQNFNL